MDSARLWKVNNWPLLAHVVRKGKPMIISTGTIGLPAALGLAWRTLAAAARTRYL
jgi:sialic acid synthase SpsE